MIRRFGAVALLAVLSVAAAQDDSGVIDTPRWDSTRIQSEFFRTTTQDFVLGMLAGVMTGGLSLAHGRRRGRK